MKIIGFIIIGLLALFIVRNSIDIIKTIKERKRARPPDIENEGKENGTE